MTTQDNSSAKTTTELADAHSEPYPHEQFGDDNTHVQENSMNVEHEKPSPTHKSHQKVIRREKVITPQSFIEFVRHYGTPETIVFLDTYNGRACSILNYMARKEPPKKDDDSAPVIVYDSKPPSLRSDWQVVYELSYTPEWKLLKSLTKQALSDRESALLLLKLRDYFVEPESNDDDNLSFIETEMSTFLLQVLNVSAPQATDEEMVKLVLDNRTQKGGLLINFALPVHSGCNALEAMILVEKEGDKINFTLLNHEQLLLDSAKSGTAKIRTSLRDSFPVFDTDLENFDG